MSDLRRIRCLLAFVGIAAAVPALGQDGRVYPPVPGPFLVAPVFPQMPAAPTGPVGPSAGLAPPAMAAPGMAAPTPSFAPPVNAMRMPYWMQPQPGVPAAPRTPDAAPETRSAAQAGEAQGRTVPAPAAGPGGTYGQATAPGAFPGYAAPFPGAGQSPQAPNMAAPQGYGAQQPGWGYTAPPGWVQQPYMPGPGWGGWTPVAPGTGN